jgi:hypothetical protein
VLEKPTAGNPELKQEEEKTRLLKDVIKLIDVAAKNGNSWKKIFPENPKPKKITVFHTQKARNNQKKNSKDPK